MASKRLLELTALAMVGEGVIGAAYPEKHLQLWNVGPQPLRTLVAALASRPTLMRITFAAEAIAGLWLAQRELKSEVAKPDESEQLPSSGSESVRRSEPDAEQALHAGAGMST